MAELSDEQKEQIHWRFSILAMQIRDRLDSMPYAPPEQIPTYRAWIMSYIKQCGFYVIGDLERANEQQEAPDASA